MTTLIVREARRVLSDGQRRFELTVAAMTLAPADRKALVGPSGCGKTTAMELAALARLPDSAQAIGLSGPDGRWTDLSRFSTEALARMRARCFGYILQSATLMPFLSIGENIELTQRVAGRRDRRLIGVLLEALDIRMPQKTMPSALSVGQRQRVAIARALAHRPDFIIADEPTAALDPASAHAAIALIVALADAQGAAVLVVSHDEPLVSGHGFTIVPVTFSNRDDTGSSRVDDGSGERRRQGEPLQ